jgi:hypothetical protein
MAVSKVQQGWISQHSTEGDEAHGLANHDRHRREPPQTVDKIGLIRRQTP